MKKLYILFLVLLSFLLVGCTKDNKDQNIGDTLKLSFKDALSYTYLKKNENKKVSISGYMATSSPVDGSFMFLMNLPYQSCPFCKPNTSQLSNTIEAYPKNNSKFTYTEQAITVTGTLVVSKTENDCFTDKYGYEFNFKIVDATYEILDTSNMSDDLILWQEVASSNLISDIYDMLDYVNFLAKWNTYFVNSYTDIDGNEVTGYYLYASDALNYIKNDGSQFNYGYKSNYFTNLKNKANKLNNSKLNDLINIINDSEALAKEGLNALEKSEYTCEYKYVEKFKIYDYIYSINKGADFSTEMDNIYNRFNDWFTSFLDDLEM